MSEDMNKLNENQLEQVVGGARRTVHNDSSSYSYIRSGPARVNPMIHFFCF